MANKAFYDLSAQTLRGLDEARERFAELLKKTPRPSPSERAQIQIELAQIEAHWQKVYQETLAAAQAALTVGTPTEEDVRLVKEMADKLDGMSAENTSISEVVASAAHIMNIWRKTDAQPKA